MSLAQNCLKYEKKKAYTGLVYNEGSAEGSSHWALPLKTITYMVYSVAVMDLEIM